MVVSCCADEGMRRQTPSAAIAITDQRRPAIRGEDVLRYLCETSEEDAVALLQSLHKRKPRLISRVVPPPAPDTATKEDEMDMTVQKKPKRVPEMKHLTASSRGQTSMETNAGADTGDNTDSQHQGQVLLQKALDESRTMQAAAQAKQSLRSETTMPIVQFSSIQFFGSETQGKTVIDVMRLGSSVNRSVVHYRTKDWSAIAGEQYIAQTGRLVFEPGDSIKEFVVEIISDDAWHTTTEFVVELIPDKCTNCMLDAYLHVAKVKVIDDDTFPTSTYAKEIRSQAYDEIKGAGLVTEYIKFNFTDPVIRKGTIKMVMVDQLHNLYFVFRLFMNIYLVDKVLSNDVASLVGGSKQGTLMWLALINTVFFAVLFKLDVRKYYWRVGGKSRSIMQKSLLRKFLNYSEESRQHVDQGSLVTAMTRDSVLIVKDGYMNTIKLIRALGQILMIMLFQLTAPALFGRPYRLLMLIAPSVSFPVLLITFLVCRMKKTTRTLLAMNLQEDTLVDYVNVTAENYRIIADYSMRGKYVDQFESIINELNRLVVNVRVTTLHNLYFPQLITTLFVSGYMIFGGMMVRDPNDPNSKGMTLGMFLSDIAVFGQIGVCWGIIYQSMLEIMTVMPALERVTTFLNLPTDLGVRAQMSDWNRLVTREKRALLLGKGDDYKLPIDLLPIRVKDFELEGSEGGARRGGLMEVGQGSLVALVGRRGQGKATLLKVVSGVVLPKTSADMTKDPGVFMPSHVRVLHCSLQPLFIVGTLYENLTFGVKTGHPDGERSRVVAICRMLKINEDVIKVVEGDNILPWDMFLSQTQKQALCIARALITNPEVMCIHKPTQVFDPETALEIMKALRLFVVNKGVETNDETWHLRRVRTCMFTSTDRMNVLMADQVFHISLDGIKEVDKASVTEHDLC